MELSTKPSVKTNAVRIGDLEIRVTKMEHTLAVNSDTLRTTCDTVEKVRSDTAEILEVLTAAKGVAGFVKKHGPRFAYLMIGIAASAGWISTETGHSISVLFGLT